MKGCTALVKNGEYTHMNKKEEQLEKHYNLFTCIMKDLQPIAFFISASLVLAVFLNDDPAHQRYALFSSLSFFLAYLSLAASKISKYNLFFNWGFILILFGMYYVYKAFGGIVLIISNVDDMNFNFTILNIIAVSAVVFVKFLLDYSKKNTPNKITYKISKYTFWAGTFLLFVGIITNIYLNFNSIIIIFGFTFLFISTSISSLNYGYHNIDISKPLKEWLRKENNNNYSTTIQEEKEQNKEVKLTQKNKNVFPLFIAVISLGVGFFGNLFATYSFHKLSNMGVSLDLGYYCSFVIFIGFIIFLFYLAYNIVNSKE